MGGTFGQEELLEFSHIIQGKFLEVKKNPTPNLNRLSSVSLESHQSSNACVTCTPLFLHPEEPTLYFEYTKH